MWRLCTNIYIDNMQSILIEQDVRLKIELARPTSSVVETWSVQAARGAPERSFDEDAGADWPIRASLCMASACGTYSVHLHKPIIITLRSDAAHDNPTDYFEVTTRKASVEAGIRRNAMCYNTWICFRHLGICNRICVKLLRLMSGVITHNSVKNIYINKWLRYSHL